jgi:Na+-transporting NADH:ubiquinone oxidoreductase subunit NqrC
LVQFWLGDNGFGPYLNNLRTAAIVADGGGE